MIAAVDIGGTKTLVAVFDDHGEVLEEQRLLTSQDYDIFMKDLRDIVTNLTTKDFKKAVAAIPGIVNRDEGIGVQFGNLDWSNVPIEADLEKLFHCPAIVENDAKAAGLHEAKLIINDFKEVLYVTIGTGIGLAYVSNGIINPIFGDRGGNQIQLEHNGKLVGWESFASGKAIVGRYGKKAGEITDEATWKHIARDLGLGIWNLVAIVEPDVIVIGGGVGSHFDRFKKFLEQELKSYETPLLSAPPLRQASKPEEAVIYGCYDLAKDSHGSAR